MLAALQCRLINAHNICSMSRSAKSSNEMFLVFSPAFIDMFVASHTSVHLFLFSLYELSPLEMVFSGREKGRERVDGVDVRGVKK